MGIFKEKRNLQKIKYIIQRGKLLKVVSSDTRPSEIISIPLSTILEVSDTSGQVAQRLAGEQEHDSAAAEVE